MSATMQLQQQVRSILQREERLEQQFDATSRNIDLAAFAATEAFPVDEAGQINAGADAPVQEWVGLLNEFCQVDAQQGGRAQLVWPVFLVLAFPFMEGWSLTAMVVALLARAHYHRRSGASDLQYVELFCGKGNLSRACIAHGLRGVSLGICVNEKHDVLTGPGLRLLLTALTSTVAGAMLWVATPCSSFVVLSASGHQRGPDNAFLGDSGRFFVEQGNVLADISGLALFLGYLLSLKDGLEQPGSSCLPLTPVVYAVLEFIGAMRSDTYHFCFGGPTLKPLQIWSRCESMKRIARPRPYCPAMEETALAKKSENGAFTGRKDLLAESQEYSIQFGRCVVAALFQ